MYGVKDNSTSLPPMPMDGDSWSVMHSWSMPTKSFLEFVMFSRFEFFFKKKIFEKNFVFNNMGLMLICRMFVDALDAQVYDEHHESGLCYLSLSKVKIFLSCNLVYD